MILRIFRHKETTHKLKLDVKGKYIEEVEAIKFVGVRIQLDNDVDVEIAVTSSQRQHAGSR